MFMFADETRQLSKVSWVDRNLSLDKIGFH